MTQRALFILTSDRMGGAERITHTIAKEAAASDEFDKVEILLLCWSRTGTFDDLERYPNITLRYALAPNHAIGIWRMIRSVRTSHYRLVFSSALHVNAVCSLLRRIGLLHVDRLVSRESTVIFDRTFGWFGRFVKALYRLYGAQDLIICQTDRMRSSIDGNTGGRLSGFLATIHNPIDLDRIREGLTQPVPVEIDAIPHERTKIVWCGRFVSVKNPSLAVDTLKSLHARGRLDMHLIMIGDGPDRTSVQAHADAIGLTDHVTLTGHRANPSNIMSRCQLGLLTSDTEGFPNVILELLASGVSRVATTDCAGELGNLPGVIVSVDHTADALATSLMQRTDDYLTFSDVNRPADYLKAILGVKRSVRGRTSHYARHLRSGPVGRSRPTRPVSDGT